MPKHGLRSERFPLLWTPDRRRRCLAANSFGKAEVVKSRGQSEMASAFEILEPKQDVIAGYRKPTVRRR